MSTSTNTGGGGAGGFEKATTETTTGDAETLLQETPLPDADGVYNVIGRTSVVKKDAANEYAAIKRLEKSIRKAGGSIQQVVDHSDNESFQDLVGGLFSDADLTLKDGANGPGLYGRSPSRVSSTPTLDKTRDQSVISGIPNNVDDASCDTDSGGFLHYVFDDSSANQITYYPEGGPKEQISSKRTKDMGQVIDCESDSNEFVHVVFIDTSDNLIYATNESGSWVEETIASADDKRRVSIALNPNDVPHVVWNNSTTNNTDYAERVGGSWSVTTDIDGVSGNTFQSRIEVASENKVGVAFEDVNGGTTGFVAGGPGNFTTDGSIHSDRPAALSVAIRSDGDWLVAIVDQNQNLIAGVGNPSSGFTTTTIDSPFDANNTDAVLAVQGSDGQYILVQGNSGGSDPYDARLYTDASGSWGFDSEITQLGAAWSSHKNDFYWTITDNGAGDSTLASIRIGDSIDIPLKFNTGAEVTNADA